VRMLLLLLLLLQLAVALAISQLVSRRHVPGNGAAIRRRGKAGEAMNDAWTAV